MQVQQSAYALPKPCCPYCAVPLHDRCSHLLAIDRWYRRSDQTPPVAVQACEWILSPFGEEGLVRLRLQRRRLSPQAAAAYTDSRRMVPLCLINGDPECDFEHQAFDELLQCIKIPISIVDALVGSRSTYCALVWWRYYLSPEPERARKWIEVHLREWEQVLDELLKHS